MLAIFSISIKSGISSYSRTQEGRNDIRASRITFWIDKIFTTTEIKRLLPNRAVTFNWSLPFRTIAFCWLRVKATRHIRHIVFFGASNYFQKCNNFWTLSFTINTIWFKSLENMFADNHEIFIHKLKHILACACLIVE